MQSTCYSCQILMKLESARYIFEKILKYQISLKSIRWEQSCSTRMDGRTDRHVKANSTFLKFCECTQNFAPDPYLEQR